MKRSILTLILITATLSCFAQWQWNLNFENFTAFNSWHLRLDTAAHPGSKWQVGSPSKTVFTGAYSQPNVIVTDTANPVPANDTSSFFLYHRRDTNMSVPFHFFQLSFWHRMNGDTTDAGSIQVSPDYGAHWIDLLTQDSAYQMWWTTKPSLCGNTGGWQYLNINMSVWASDKNNSFPVAMNNDTVIFRFTYRTNGDTILHDGWMIDDIYVQDWWEGIPELRNDRLISIYPNPASETLYIAATDIGRIPATVSIYDATGRIVYQHAGQQQLAVDVSGLVNGIYFLRCADGQGYAVKRFTVQR